MPIHICPGGGPDRQSKRKEFCPMKKILKLLVQGMSNCYTPALDNYYMIH